MASETNRRLALHCRDITKTYGSGEAKVFALRGIDLNVYRGELLMLVGSSGCGKTTFISVISTLLKPDSGECIVLEHDINTMTETEKADFRSKSIGFVFQAFNLLPALTAEENVAMPLFIQKVPRKTALQKARAMLDTVGLESRYQALPAKLSGGQQQRVAIARALVHNPQLIVCDEPTSSLDHQSGHKVMEVLRGIAKGIDRTLIVVTHDNRIYDFADRIAHMDDGRIVGIEQGKAKGRA